MTCLTLCKHPICLSLLIIVVGCSSLPSDEVVLIKSPSIFSLPPVVVVLTRTSARKLAVINAINDATEAPVWGLFRQRRVNVLILNLVLDQLQLEQR